MAIQQITKKRIIKAADIDVGEAHTFPTEYAEADYEGMGQVKVYNKGKKKYIKDSETGEFKQIKDKSIVTGRRKVKKLSKTARGKMFAGKDDYKLRSSYDQKTEDKYKKRVKQEKEGKRKTWTQIMEGKKRKKKN